ncbi:MAG: caspase family protein [Flavobacteriaceae bacterium]|nr:caspase family protein [Flavobacteriaceae bacterium]
MKRLLICFILFAISFQSFAEKYALIIAVGEYPRKTGWSSISSVNDVGLIKQALTSQKFKDENIFVLKNEEADREGIMKAFEELKAKIKPGDIVVIHYSGHGQQIYDDNGDEIDDKDESIVPYDALVRYTSYYKGENHIRDDELGNIIANFRNTLGDQGQLLMLLDSCHSGTASRGGKARGGEATFAPPGWTPGQTAENGGSGLLERTKLNEKPAPFVLLSGASANELNYEYEGYGSLSFAFLQAMNDLGTDFTYRQLFSKIQAIMSGISPNQKPTIEGDSDYKLFKGEYVKQQPYLEIAKIIRSDALRIKGGKLQRLFKGTTVNILPAGTTEVEESKIIAKGRITKANYSDAIIRLDSELSSDIEQDYWVFIDQPSYGDISLKVYLDKKTTDNKSKTVISDFLSENSLGELVDSEEASQVILGKSEDQWILNATQGIQGLDTIPASRGDESLSDLKNKLFNFAQGNYLKNLSLKNFDYEFEFKLLPIHYDEDLEELADLLPENDQYNKNGVFQVNTSSDHVVLQVTNKSDQPVYFTIIEINTKGEIASFMPTDDCPYADDERRLNPGETKVFMTCDYSFIPPEETLVLKGFATPTPINFKPTIETRGEGNSRGNQNPLERFIGGTYEQSRGGSGSRTGEKIDGYSTEFVYEIKNE